MKMKLTDRQKSVGLSVVWVFTICLLIAIAVWRFSALMGIFSKILAVLAPVLWGLVIAYLMSPLQAWMERRLHPLMEKKKPHPVLVRVCSVTGCMVLLLALLVGLVATLLPELINSVKSLMTNLPEYLTSAGKWTTNRIAGLEDEQPQLYEILTGMLVGVQDALSNFVTEFEPKVDNLASGANLLTSITSGAFTIFTALKNFLLGIMVAVYLMYHKERYMGQVKKFLYASMPEKKVHRILRIGSRVSYTFMHFFSGKGLDSIIIGLLCFIGVTILGMPYTVLISLIVGVTNIIPFFGPFIGAIPCGFLVLLSNPSKVIPFAIFILALQQFDGNILGPKILGDSLGLPTFWVLFAIFVGGGLFGFVGMVAFVPLFAALYTFTKEFMTERLTRRGLPCDTESYMGHQAIYAHSPTANPPAADSEATDPLAEEAAVPDDGKDETI